MNTMTEPIEYADQIFHLPVNALGESGVRFFCAWRSWKEVPVSLERDLV